MHFALFDFVVFALDCLIRCFLSLVLLQMSDGADNELKSDRLSRDNFDVPIGTIETRQGNSV